MSVWQRLPRPVIGLSPMDGVTDAAFRGIVARYGKPDISFTEFTHVHDVCRGPECLLDSLIYDEIERPIVAQLYGKDPALFYQAAHAVCELGFDGLDVNMGCPSKNVASSGSGAALIRTPALAHEIIRAARRGIADWTAGQTMEAAGIKPVRAEAIRRLNERQGRVSAVERRSIPLSVKTRLGYDEVIVERWIEHLLQEAPAAISLHGRTLQQMYRGEADWQAIARAVAVARGTGTLLLGNGDVQSLEEIVRRIRQTGVDGVLVGRAVLGTPWFFREKEGVRRTAEAGTAYRFDTSAPLLATRFDLLLEHARRFERQFGIGQFRRMRKHLGWYCKGFPHAAALRAHMFRVSSVADVETLLNDYRAQRIIGSGAETADSLVSEAVSLASRCG